MKKILTLFILLIFPLVGLAAEKPVWITAEGESYQGEMDTLKEVKTRAKREAETKAVEMAVERSLNLTRWSPTARLLKI